MRNKERAFTLVELLAVIVILAIILAIAIPTISGIIGAATRGAFESDAKLLIKAVDYKQLAGVEFDVEQLKKDPDTSEDTVSSILGVSTDNYQEIAFYKDEFGKTNVLIIGQNKWADLVAYGTSINMAVDDSSTFEGGYVCAGTVGDAKATDVLSGKGFTSDGGIQTGTMSDNTGDVTAQSVSRSGTTLKFKPQEGYYPGDASNNLTYAEPNLVASNIKQGATIFGLAGSIPDKTGDVTAPSISRSGTTIKLKPQEGYYSGDASNNLAYSDANFIASNIKEGISIFGLSGTLVQAQTNGVQEYNAAGSFTFTVPANVTRVFVTMVGGGGGGGGSHAANSYGGAGGGGGGAVISALTVTPGAAMPVAVGSAGGGSGPAASSTWGPANGKGGNGTNSSFGGLIAYGGVGGSLGNAGIGGTGSGYGGNGSAGAFLSSYGGFSGIGGLGLGATSYGKGGTGASPGGSSGTAGTSGRVVISW